MENKFNLFEFLMSDKNVNNFTKALIFISQCNHYNRYYIPNKLIMNKLGTNKYNTSRLINQLKERGIIKIQYIGHKRYIKIINFNYEENIANSSPFDYDWLSELD